jgi:hypothetical protein
VQPAGISVTGKLTAGRRLTIEIANRSRSTVAIPQPYQDGLPPTVCYRLFSGDTEVKKGTLPMAAGPIKGEAGSIDIGASRTLMEPGGHPCFADLPAGDYRLECFLETNAVDDQLPWGMADAPYFEMEFHVK